MDGRRRSTDQGLFTDFLNKSSSISNNDLHLLNSTAAITEETVT